jgi:hypothetical protein
LGIGQQEIGQSVVCARVELANAANGFGRAVADAIAETFGVFAEAFE